MTGQLAHALATIDELHAFLERGFAGSTKIYEVTAVSTEGVNLRYHVTAQNARPGGTVSGPTMMTMADTVAWLAVAAQIGPVAMAVTSSLHIDFLHKPALEDLIAVGTLLKLGQHLAVVDVTLASISTPELLVAKAQVTYSLPAKRDELGN
jgi:uncharacterized protein (TIGR00369 family)